MFRVYEVQGLGFLGFVGFRGFVEDARSTRFPGLIWNGSGVSPVMPRGDVPFASLWWPGVWCEGSHS